VLSTVHANALGMDVSTALILQLHRDLYQFSPTAGGSWKSIANDIVDDAAINESVTGYRSVGTGGQVDALVAVTASASHHPRATSATARFWPLRSA
jgi:hypothetical protein